MDKVYFDNSAIETSDSMSAFYKNVGVADKYFKNDDYNDVMCYWMNLAQNEELNRCIKENAKKNKKYKHVSKVRLEEMASWDWLNYSPVSDETIPRNELWIYSKDEAKIALKNFRARKRKEEENDH